MRLSVFLLFALCILVMVVLLPFILSILEFLFSVFLVLSGAVVLFIIIMFFWGFFRG